MVTQHLPLELQIIETSLLGEHLELNKWQWAWILGCCKSVSLHWLQRSWWLMLPENFTWSWLWLVPLQAENWVFIHCAAWLGNDLTAVLLSPPAQPSSQYFKKVGWSSAKWKNDPFEINVVFSLTAVTGQEERHLRNRVFTVNLQFSATAESNTSETGVLIFTCIWPKLRYPWIIQICNYCIWCITGYNGGNEKQCSSAADCICLPNHKDINLRCSHWWSTLQPLIKILANSSSSFPLQSKFHGVF